MISARGWCLEHGTQRQVANNQQISKRKGEYFERWYEANRRAFEFPRFLDGRSARD